MSRANGNHPRRLHLANLVRQFIRRNSSADAVTLKRTRSESAAVTLHSILNSRASRKPSLARAQRSRHRQSACISPAPRCFLASCSRHKSLAEVVEHGLARLDGAWGECVCEAKTLDVANTWRYPL